MNIFFIYALNFFGSGSIGVILLSWFQNLYLNGDTQLFIDTLPLTIVSLFILAAIVLAIAYFTLKPLIKTLTILKSEDREATLEEKQLSITTEKKLEKLTLIAMTIGFIVGVLGTYFVKIGNGSLDFELPRTILVILQAFSFGALASMHTIFVTNSKFIKYRKLLKITKLEEKDLNWKITTIITFFIIVLIIFLSVNLISVPYQAVIYGEFDVDNPTVFYFIQCLKVFIFSILLVTPSL